MKISEEMFIELRELSQKYDMSLGNLIRRAIEDYLSKQKLNGNLWVKSLNGKLLIVLLIVLIIAGVSLIAFSTASTSGNIFKNVDNNNNQNNQQVT